MRKIIIAHTGQTVAFVLASKINVYLGQHHSIDVSVGLFLYRFACHLVKTTLLYTKMVAIDLRARRDVGRA